MGDENGVFIDQFRIYGLLALCLLQTRSERGAIVKTLSTTSMLDVLGKKFNVPVHETGVSFKFVAPKMMETDAIIGGEESGGYAFRGHVPERDGILANLFFLDFMVKTGLKPSQLLKKFFDIVGEHYYDRIDIAGPERRGLATGLNEFAGYIAVVIAAYAAAEIAVVNGLRPAPFSVGILVVLAGLLLSVFFVRDTRAFVDAEVESGRSQRGTMNAPSVPDRPPPAPGTPASASLGDIFSLTWRDRRFFACNRAGMVNNLNDGMAWAAFPLFFASLGYSIRTIGFLAALYPAVWGVTQFATGPLSDRIGRRGLIAWGMIVQATGIWAVVFFPVTGMIVAGNVLLGLGTAMVYPTLLASVSDISRPEWRATALGVYSGSALR